MNTLAELNAQRPNQVTTEELVAHGKAECEKLSAQLAEANAADPKDDNLITSLNHELFLLKKYVYRLTYHQL